jgi:hypothetical protein
VCRLNHVILATTAPASNPRIEYFGVETWRHGPFGSSLITWPQVFAWFVTLTWSIPSSLWWRWAGSQLAGWLPTNHGSHGIVGLLTLAVCSSRYNSMMCLLAKLCTVSSVFGLNCLWNYRLRLVLCEESIISCCSSLKKIIQGGNEAVR